MKSVFLLTIGLALGALLSGCASIKTQVIEKDRSLKDVQNYFVLRNLKDNHGINESIVRALKARGLHAETGPITLLPDSAQAVLLYEDRWAWDFSDHMVFLRISARDPQAVFPYLSASYQKQVAFSTERDVVVAEVIDKLIASGR